MTRPSLPGGMAAARASTSVVRPPSGWRAAAEDRAGPADDRATVADGAPTTHGVGQGVAEQPPRGVQRRRGTTMRTAPLVPSDRPATPGAMAPVPRLPSGPSPAPTTTGRPAGSRPGRSRGEAAASPSWARSRAAAPSGCRRARRPGVPVRLSMSSRPVPDADDSSVDLTGRRGQDEVLEPHPPARAGGDSGSCWANHLSFVNGVIGWTGVPGPVELEGQGRGAQPAGLVAGARVRPRDHRGQGLRCSSRPIRPCIAVLTDRASTGASPTAAAHAASASTRPC